MFYTITLLVSNPLIASSNISNGKSTCTKFYNTFNTVILILGEVSSSILSNIIKCYLYATLYIIDKYDGHLGAIDVNKNISLISVFKNDYEYSCIALIFSLLLPESAISSSSSS
jgi:hypothetical protein